MNYDEAKSFTHNKHQIHIEVSEELYQAIKNILPEKGMTTMVIRQLIKIYVANVTKNNMNPMHIFRKEGEINGPAE